MLAARFADYLVARLSSSSVALINGPASSEPRQAEQTWLIF
jgi:hypothetical protein